MPADTDFRPIVFDENGRELDAKARLLAIDILDLEFLSAGGGANKDYNSAIETVLDRAQKSGVFLHEARLVKRQASHEVVLEADFSLENIQATKARKRLGELAKSIESEASYGGNYQRRLRLLFRLPSDCNTQRVIAGILQPQKKGAAIDLTGFDGKFEGDCLTHNIRCKRDLPLILLASALGKPFVILTGLSGSGKTKVAQALVLWLSESKWQHLLVPVGADWTSNVQVLGYPSGLDADAYVGTPLLELVLRADKDRSNPYFLILDEMNLSHVERYFSDFLSAMESGEPIPLYQGKKRGDVPQNLELPPNLFVIGTVNVDETTYMFSPKVLDRANVIEFTISASDLDKYLDHPRKPDLEQLAGKGGEFAQVFVKEALKRLADQESDATIALVEEVREEFKNRIKDLFAAIAPERWEFGYRTAHEAARFVYFYKKLGGHPDDPKQPWFDEAMDCVIVQKLLPKMHGSKSRLRPALVELWKLCFRHEPEAKHLEPKRELAEDTRLIRYPLSAAKIVRMVERVEADGYASFAEA